MSLLSKLQNIQMTDEYQRRQTDALERIADALEGILGATDPIPAQPSDFPGKDIERVFYTDDRREIVDHLMRKLGKERGPSTTKR